MSQDCDSYALECVSCVRCASGCDIVRMADAAWLWVIASVLRPLGPLGLGRAAPDARSHRSFFGHQHEDSQRAAPDTPRAGLR